MDDDIDIVEEECFRRLSVMSFEERAYRIIESFYLWQKDMTFENMDGRGIGLLINFSEWLYEPDKADDKKMILMRVEQALGRSAQDYKIPRPGNDD